LKSVAGPRLAALLCQLLAATCAVAAATPADPVVELRETDFEPIGALVRAEIERGHIPGAVVVIGQGERVLYRQAFGDREVEPRRVAMRPDTIFDLASLTKPVATAIAILQLRDRGQLDLDQPAARYWPAFGRRGKQHITLRQLLTHQSGLRPDLDLTTRWQGYAAALERIEAEVPRHRPGTHYEYSDINFEALGEIVRRVSGVPLDVYCRAHIFEPLGMADTGFRPPAAARDRIAPTGDVKRRIPIGVVNDPTAARMGGVAGHAGLFSTADDLVRLAQMLVGSGRTRDGVQVLTTRSIDDMARPGSLDPAIHPRGLGWDLAAPLAANRDELAPAGSYGHTGFTGTMIWIDPRSGTYVIVLTSRTHPHGTGDAAPLRAAVLAFVSERLGPVSAAHVITNQPALRSFYERTAATTSGVGQPGVATEEGSSAAPVPR
jgi:CubicO group peptidase (beta-lactamase class C family)